MSLAPKRSAIWPIFSPCVTQLACRLAKLSRYSRLTASVLRYSHRRRAWASRPGGMAGLKGPAIKAVKPPRLVLQIGATAPGARSARPGSRRGRTSWWPSRGRPTRASAADVQPSVGRGLAGADRAADAIDENFRPAAGQAPQAGRLQPLQHRRATRQPGHVGHVDDFRRAEAVDVDLRKTPLDVAEQLLVPGQVNSGCRPPCKQDLVAAQGDRLFDLAEQLVAADDVALRIAGPRGRTRRTGSR